MAATAVARGDRPSTRVGTSPEPPLISMISGICCARSGVKASPKSNVADGHGPFRPLRPREEVKRMRVELDPTATSTGNL
jgi:hypothetical protein